MIASVWHGCLLAGFSAPLRREQADSLPAAIRVNRRKLMQSKNDGNAPLDVLPHEDSMLSASFLFSKLPALAGLPPSEDQQTGLPEAIIADCAR
jgi:hypothetical protein